MAGNNKGKKYVKLRGGEIATPENEERAFYFMAWYGRAYKGLKKEKIHGHDFDEDLASETALHLYDCIALRGHTIKDYKGYFARAYHTIYIASTKRARIVSIDAPVWSDENDGVTVSDLLAAPDFDYEFYEETIDALKTEITEYVRANYDPAACSLFEIYIALQPEISYKKLAKMLGFPVQKVWPVIGAIKKDLIETFTARKDYFLSLI